MKNSAAYYAILETASNGYGVIFPDVAGCFSHGDDFEDAKRMAAEALSLYFDDFDPAKDELPPRAWNGSLDTLSEEYSDIDIAGVVLISVDLPQE